MKYCFEKYEFCDRGKIFLGFQQVEANSIEEAREIAQQKAGEGITLAQIFIYQDSQ